MVEKRAKDEEDKSHAPDSDRVMNGVKALSLDEKVDGQTHSAKASPKKMNMRDYKKLKFLGEGSYARVLLVKHKESGKIYAMKAILKAHMRKEKKEYQVKIERDVLVATSHPNIIRLHYSFRDEEKLYFVLEYAPNGELSDLIKAAETLPFALAQHFAAEIVNMLEYLHSKGIAHRDLKPENILLSEDYHLKLADFGTAKFMGSGKNVAENPLLSHMPKAGSTFVGTAEYVSPEVLLDKESGPASDLWALGCIVYLFFVGKPPFSNKTEYLIFESILKGSFKCPPHMDPLAQSLCKELLMVDPSKRLGSGPKGYETLKGHEFFKGIDFAKLHTVKPPIDPPLLFKLQSEKKRVVAPAGGLNSSDEEPGSPVDGLPAVNSGESAGEIVRPREDVTLKEGIVEKKCGWFFYQKRKLVLTSRPRLSYHSASNGEYKGDVMLTKRVKAEKTGDTKFTVITPNRTYYFDGLTSAVAKEWVGAINDAIRVHCPELT